MPDINGYSIINQLGKGTYGIVYLVKDKQNYNYAMKKIDISKASRKEKEFILSEILIQKLNKSPYIINLFDTFYSNNSIYILSEYAERGDLGNFIEKTKKKKTVIKDNYICRWTLQIAWALDYLHKNGIIHRDIKSKNIFLTRSYDIKVGDLGIAKIQENKKLTKTYVGTPYYMSPEVITNRFYNQKADIWSLGCILYELITLNVPFNGKDMKNLENNINRQIINTNFKSNYKKEYIELLRKMLHKNYTYRCDIESITNSYFLIKVSNNITINSPKSNFNKHFNRMNVNIPRRNSWNFLLDKIKGFKIATAYNEKSEPNNKIDYKYKENYKKNAYKYKVAENKKNSKNAYKVEENKQNYNRNAYVYNVADNKQELPKIKSNRQKTPVISFRKNSKSKYNYRYENYNKNNHNKEKINYKQKIDEIKQKIKVKKELQKKKDIYLPKIRNKKNNVYINYISEYKRNYNSPYSIFN